MFIGLISSLRLPNHYSLSNTVRTEWSLLFKGSTREIFTNTAVCWSHLFSAPSALTTFLITTVSAFSNMLTRGPRTERTQQCYVKTISTEFFLLHQGHILPLQHQEDWFILSSPSSANIGFLFMGGLSSWTSYPMDGNQKCSALHNIF